MKRGVSINALGVRFADPFENLSQDQLTYIGAVAMLYNDVEDQVDSLCGYGLQIPIHEAEVLSRINGIEGKIELIKLAAKHWGFDESESLFLAEALGNDGFMLLKKWRDAVIHARVYDYSTAVALVPERRGKFSEVMVSQDALEGLYKRLQWLNTEIWFLQRILERRSRLSRGGLAPEHRERLEQENRGAWIQVRERRSQRISLPPMPDFPEDRFAASRLPSDR